MDNQNGFDSSTNSDKFKKTYDEALKRQDDLLKAKIDSLNKVFEESTKHMKKNSSEYNKLLETLYEKEAEFKKETASKKEQIDKYYLSRLSRYRRESFLKDRKEELDAYQESLKKEKEIYETFNDNLTKAQKKRLDAVNDELNDTKKKIDELDEQLKNVSNRTKREEQRQQRRQANLNKRDAETARFKDQFSNASGWGRLGSIASFFTSGGFGAELRENLFAIGDSLLPQVGTIISNMVKKTLNKVDQAIEDVNSHRAPISARMQGASHNLGVYGSASEYFGEYNYDILLEKVQNELAISPFVKQKDYLQKLDEAVDKGIAYNVEQRAFLSSIKDNIATTFDAFDSNLLRLIRLQQADSTKARLGMEAALTRTLNQAFSDTSFLNKVKDDVTAALVDTEAMMTKQAATEFEYIVQKWMGALYSLGASDKMVGQIAQGLNYIGTGNVQALASNAPLQTLFAMSASRSGGLDYADLLTGGLNAQKTNELLKSMVEYLKEIAEDSSNNVVRSAYGDLYQMSLSDMKAITSLTNEDINSLYNQSYSYSDMETELTQQLVKMPFRMGFGKMLENVTENAIYNIGSNIADDVFTYVMWELTDLIKDATDGIHLPAISVMGNMVDLSSFTLDNMLKTGIVGLTTLGQLGSIVASLGNLGGLNLNSWGYEESLARGQIIERGGQFSQTAGSFTTTSGSTYVGSGSGEDIKNSSIAAATEDAQSIADITNKDMEAEYTFDDWYNAVLVDHEPIFTMSNEEFTSTDIYNALFNDKIPVMIDIDPSSVIGMALLAATGVGEKYTFDNWYEETLLNHTPLFTRSSDDFTITDLYKSLYIDKAAIPVMLDYSTGLGQALYTLANSMNSSNKITDVNIKKSEVPVDVSISRLDNKMKEEIKNYIKSTYISILSEELKETLLGSSKNGGVTIAEACEALVNDKVNVEVKNSGFDDAINNYLRFGV